MKQVNVIKIMAMEQVIDILNNDDIDYITFYDRKTNQPILTVHDTDRFNQVLKLFGGNKVFNTYRCEHNRLISPNKINNLINSVEILLVEDD